MELISCGICLATFQEGERLKVLDCNLEANDPKPEEHVNEKLLSQHIFHEGCISEWFFKKVECPLCRKSFKDSVTKFIKNLRRRERRGRQQI